MSRNQKRRSVYFSEPIERYLEMVGTENYSGSLNTAVDRYLLLVSDYPDLTKNEYCLILDALSGIVTDNPFYRHAEAVIYLEIKDAIRIDKLDEKWEVNRDDLMHKINNLTKSQAFSIIHLIEIFNNLNDSELVIAKAGLKLKEQA